MLWNRLTRVLGFVTVLFCAVSVGSPFWNGIAHHVSIADTVRPSDAVVVLSTGLAAEGTLGEESLRRAFHGIRLYQDNLAPLLVLSGTGNGEGTISEAGLRAQLARGMGVPQDAILLEETAQTTHEE